MMSDRENSLSSDLNGQHDKDQSPPPSSQPSSSSSSSIHISAILHDPTNDGEVTTTNSTTTLTLTPTNNVPNNSEQDPLHASDSSFSLSMVDTPHVPIPMETDKKDTTALQHNIHHQNNHSNHNNDNNNNNSNNHQEEWDPKQIYFQHQYNEWKKQMTFKNEFIRQLQQDAHQFQIQKQTWEEQVQQYQQKEIQWEKMQIQYKERIHFMEQALWEEQQLNEERKEKMKHYVEKKAEELHAAKSYAQQLKLELTESNAALQSLRKKLEEKNGLVQQDQDRIRELLKENHRLKKNTDQLSQLGDTLELELHKTAQENEEHKSKRMEARHELMTLLRKLEVEQAAKEYLRESILFTFSPKAKSQQQLLQDCLHDLEQELYRLSRKLGRTMPMMNAIPSTSNNVIATSATTISNSNTALSSSTSTTRMNSNFHRDMEKKQQPQPQRNESDIVSNMNTETQLVSQGILALSNAIERMHLLLDDDSGEKTCVSTLATFLQNATSSIKVMEHTRILTTPPSPTHTPRKKSHGMMREDDDYE